MKNSLELVRAEGRAGSITLGERALLLFSRRPGSEDYPSTTTGYTLENALKYARKTIPGFDQLIHDKLVLDFGCGHGWQAVAMHQAGRAASSASTSRTSSSNTGGRLRSVKGAAAAWPFPVSCPRSSAGVSTWCSR